MPRRVSWSDVGTVRFLTGFRGNGAASRFMRTSRRIDFFRGRKNEYISKSNKDVEAAATLIPWAKVCMSKREK